LPIYKGAWIYLYIVDKRNDSEKFNL
jgi:hypothetical protein